MQVGMLGVSYKSCGLAQRERFAKIASQFFADSSRSLVLLSTCHRTELYFGGEDLQSIPLEMLIAMQEGMDSEQLFYTRLGHPCFVHLARVITGVDSALFGETQIQGQVKRAYELAKKSKQLTPDIHYLFQKGLKIGKATRTTFHLPKEETSLEALLWELMKHFLPMQRRPCVLFIGYSEINRRALTFLKGKGALSLFLATRSQEEARGFCKKSDITLLSWKEISTFAAFDIVIVGSQGGEYLLTWDQLPKGVSSLQTKLVIDMGVPRLVDPMIGKHPLITLINMEELGSCLEKKRTISLQEESGIKQYIEGMVLRQETLFLQGRQRALSCPG
ncbi:MAG: hypothetical protein FJZ58_06715 [Chlamydiae bacterium]|nr:hypothetical protein [Chlamydiota bacterium]